MGDGPAGDRDAVRGRGGGDRARRAPGRRAHDDVYGESGPPPDAPQHVQDRRRTHADGLPHRRPQHRGAGPLHLRRPLRRDGRPRDGLGHALRQLGAGGDGLRAHRAGRHAQGPGPLPPRLRRLPDEPRGPQDRAPRHRRPPRAPLRRPRPRPPRPVPLARPPRPPRHGPEPRRLLPGARDRQPVYPRRARHRAGDDGRLRRAGRPPLPAVRLRRRRGRRARGGADGLGRRDGRGDGRAPRRKGREGRARESAALPAVLGRASPRRAARDGAGHRRAGPDEGAGRGGRAALPGRRHRALGGDGGRHRAVRPDAARRRRALRALVEGVHAGDGQGRPRQPFRGAPEEPLHRRHHRRRDAHLAGGGRAASTPRPTT